MPPSPEVVRQLQQAVSSAQFSEDQKGPITIEEKEVFEQLVRYVEVYMSERQVTRISNSAEMLAELVKMITNDPTATVEDLNPRLVTLLVKAMHRLVDFI